MGTRADFYVGRGKNAEWIGSIAMDGYPDGHVADPTSPVAKATTEKDFRNLVDNLIAHCGHGTKPEQGWPWPWDDSSTTDYAYAFEDGCVWAAGFASKWFKATDPEPEKGDKEAVFPNMKNRKNVTYGPRSGLTIIGKTV